jgi:Rod binding domain-containing protein
MSIAPPSDIVLEVARAADPTRAAAVAQRLNALGADATGSGADFAATLDRTGASPTPAALAATPVEGAPDMRARLASASLAKNDKAAKAQVQFEAMFLNNFISEMLPKDTPAAFGQGMAGDMWRSMLAEKISNQIASSGALGIGKQLFATHSMKGSAAALDHSASAGIAAAQMSANDLSMASSADIGSGAFLFARGKST